jgi:hypothetical protein
MGLEGPLNSPSYFFVLRDLDDLPTQKEGLPGLDVLPKSGVSMPVKLRLATRKLDTGVDIAIGTA